MLQIEKPANHHVVYLLGCHVVVWPNLLTQSILPFLTGVIQGARGVVTAILMHQFHIHCAILEFLTG